MPALSMRVQAQGRLLIRQKERIATAVRQKPYARVGLAGILFEAERQLAVGVKNRVMSNIAGHLGRDIWR